MIRINQVKVPVANNIDAEKLILQHKELLRKKAASVLRVPEKDIHKVEILRQSIDARKKPDIIYSYVIDVQVNGEEKILKKFAKDKKLAGQIGKSDTVKYQFPKSGSKNLDKPVVIVGMGPAGLFCGYFLALHGYRPVILERGRDVDSRKSDVEQFWQGGKLLKDSNVQFGEGGAGTFSDGKLNTLVKEKYGRNKAVLETFVQFGAKESILYDAKPHIGTDVLCDIVKKMRQEIIRLGGTVRFDSKVTDLCIEDGAIKGVIVNDQETLECEQLVLALGHSARDTFEMLLERNIPMEPKAFAVGFRVEHPQEMINSELYGMSDPGALGAAAYKVTAQTATGRGVYSFCMCPGGFVVNASSEEGRLAVNGMSYSGRDGSNANSAVIVAVTPEDFGALHPMAGIEFQRRLEEKAYKLAEGKIPVQRYGDFRDMVLQQMEQKTTFQEQVNCAGQEETGSVQTQLCETGPNPLQPMCKGLYHWSDLTALLPGNCNEAFVEGMEVFARQIKGFDDPAAILSGVESRTSSPVRIPRDEENLQSVIAGLYPCGEGAGYAGGITSAAMDGLRVAEKIAARYAPNQLH